MPITKQIPTELYKSTDYVRTVIKSAIYHIVPEAENIRRLADATKDPKYLRIFEQLTATLVQMVENEGYTHIEAVRIVFDIKKVR